MGGTRGPLPSSPDGRRIAPNGRQPPARSMPAVWPAGPSGRPVRLAGRSVWPAGSAWLAGRSGWPDRPIQAGRPVRRPRPGAAAPDAGRPVAHGRQSVATGRRHPGAPVRRPSLARQSGRRVRLAGWAYRADGARQRRRGVASVAGPPGRRPGHGAGCGRIDQPSPATASGAFAQPQIGVKPAPPAMSPIEAVRWPFRGTGRRRPGGRCARSGAIFRVPRTRPEFMPQAGSDDPPATARAVTDGRTGSAAMGGMCDVGCAVVFALRAPSRAVHCGRTPRFRRLPAAFGHRPLGSRARRPGCRRARPEAAAG